MLDELPRSPDGSPTPLRLVSHASYCFAAYPCEGRRDAETIGTEEKTMDLLWTLAVILLILWLLGLVTSFTLGGFIHILLVVAIIVVLIRVIQGRRPVL
jgi:hypothetical protein